MHRSKQRDLHIEGHTGSLGARYVSGKAAGEKVLRASAALKIP
jgi:hypothetical protein